MAYSSINVQPHPGKRVTVTRHKSAPTSSASQAKPIAAIGKDSQDTTVRPTNSKAAQKPTSLPAKPITGKPVQPKKASTDQAGNDTYKEPSEQSRPDKTQFQAATVASSMRQQPPVPKVTPKSPTTGCTP
eukprot:scaffold72362_cov34-Prasinocladus_malaysianus.AAC.2